MFSPSPVFHRAWWLNLVLRDGFEGNQCLSGSLVLQVAFILPLPWKGSNWDEALRVLTGHSYLKEVCIRLPPPLSAWRLLKESAQRFLLCSKPWRVLCVRSMWMYMSVCNFISPSLRLWRPCFQFHLFPLSWPFSRGPCVRCRFGDLVIAGCAFCLLYCLLTLCINWLVLQKVCSFWSLSFQKQHYAENKTTRSCGVF